MHGAGNLLPVWLIKLLKIYRRTGGGTEAKWRSRLSPSLTDTHTHILAHTRFHLWQVAERWCASRRASLPAKEVWGTVGALKASGPNQYSKQAFLSRGGWEEKESKSNDEARRHRANKKHLVGRYLTAGGGRFLGGSMSSFTPNSSSNVCSNGSGIVFKVTLGPRFNFFFLS